LFQIYYDDGEGFRESLSGHVRISAAPNPVTYRMPIPPGRYVRFRIDPLDRAGAIKLGPLRVVANSGRTVAEIPVRNLKASEQIEAIRAHDTEVEIVLPRGADDPKTLLAFARPLNIHASWRDYIRARAPYVLPLFAALAALLFVLERAPQLRAGVAARARAFAQRPTRAVWLVSAIAVVASAYPVVFLGKSYVSPNLGTTLLYYEYPTLPGYTSADLVDVKLSDVGAVMWQHVPFSMIQRRALAQGELPLWNRYNAAGVPLLAQGQSMFGDPLHFLVIAANGAAWAWDIKYLVAKWLFAAGLGLTVLAMVGTPLRGVRPASQPQSTDVAERRPYHFVPALLVAAAAPFIGFFLYRINHPAFFSLCYAPWPLYCLVRVAQAATRRATALWVAGLVVANIALMNSGTVKEAYMLLLCVNFSGACVLVATATSWRGLLAKLVALAWGGVIFVLLTAPVWATFLNTLKHAYTGYNAVSAYQIQPTLLLGAFDEIFYRPLMSQDRVFSPSLNFLFLAGVLYFLATLRLQFTQRAVIALAASSLVPLSLAFGLVSPQWIVTLPFLGNIAHLDNTFSCALIVLWSVVAGVGFATAAQRLGTPEGRNDLIVGALLLFALVFGWIAFRQAAHRPIFGPIFSVHLPGQVLAITPFIWDYLAALLVALVVLAIAVHRALARRSFGAARALVIATCIGVLLWRHGLHAGTVGYEDFTARPTERVDFHARSAAMELARAAQAREPSRGFGLHGNFFPGWTGVYGLETIHGPDALVNPSLRELVGVSGVQRLWDWRLYADETTVGSARPFFDALNVRFYFDQHSDQAAIGTALKLIKTSDLDIYESPTVWPRAFFTDRVALYDQPAELVEKLRAANGRALAAVQRSDVTAQAALGKIPSDLATRTTVPAANYHLTENTTSFTVHANGPGAIVLTEALWPGDIRAEVNGQPAPVVRVNHAFRGVAVDRAGDYRVTFRYWPRRFTRNLVLCGVGALLFVVSLGWALRRSRMA
jgi:hypothetical protein